MFSPLKGNFSFSVQYSTNSKMFNSSTLYCEVKIPQYQREKALKTLQLVGGEEEKGEHRKMMINNIDYGRT